MSEYALRLANGQDTAPRVRMADALPLQHAGPLAARSGLRPDGGGDVTVVTGALAVQVTPFTCWVDGGSSALQGGYPFVLDAAKVLTLADGHATLTRTDVVAVVIREDAFDGSGQTDARLTVVQGTPGAGAPALPATALPLRNVVVPAGASVGTGGLSSGALGTDRRTYVVGAGGALPVASATERNALGAVKGQLVYRTDTDTLEAFNGATWDTYVKGSALPARGSVSYTKPNGTAFGQRDVSFPAGRFSAPPTLVLASAMDTDFPAVFSVSVGLITTTGCRIYVRHHEGDTAAIGTRLGWVAYD